MSHILALHRDRYQDPHCNCRLDCTCFLSSHQYLPVSLNLARSIRSRRGDSCCCSLTWPLHPVPVGRTQSICQVGDCAHDATIGGHFPDTGKECAQDHAGRARGHLVVIFIVSWSTVGVIIVMMIDGFRLFSEDCAPANVGFPGCSGILPLCRLA